jgi:hypothetical protein
VKAGSTAVDKSVSEVRLVCVEPNAGLDDDDDGSDGEDAYRDDGDDEAAAQFVTASGCGGVTRFRFPLALGLG